MKGPSSDLTPGVAVSPLNQYLVKRTFSLEFRFEKLALCHWVQAFQIPLENQHALPVAVPARPLVAILSHVWRECGERSLAMPAFPLYQAGTEAPSVRHG